MTEKEPTLIEYLVKRWPLVVGAVGAVMWITRLQLTTIASADDIKDLKTDASSMAKATAEIPYIKQSIERVERSQVQTNEKLEKYGNLLAKIEAKL